MIDVEAQSIVGDATHETGGPGFYKRAEGKSKQQAGKQNSSMVPASTPSSRLLP